MTQEQKAKAYDEAKYIMKEYLESGNAGVIAENTIKKAFPELAESEDEKIIKELLQIAKESEDSFYMVMTPNKRERLIAWLEKQGSEPNWCHHKVDLSNCSEEYRKAYYDGWNNCNMQYSQCESEKSDVLKCLINGMKFYYEDNEEATWGTEKFSMKIKDILSWLEKQGNANKEYWRGYREGKQEILDKYAELEKQGEQKPVDKVEPKFKVKYAGNEYNVLEVKDIAGVTYYGIEDEPNHIDYVLPDNCEIVSEQKPADSYCQENCKGFQETGKCFADGECKAKREAEQKPAWSEEDNKHLERILKELENQRQRPSNRPYLEEIESDYNWLNSIKDRVQSKLEWSKEDKEMLTEIIIDLKALKNRDTGEAGKAAYQREIDWLESLRPRSQWKPSDEQIRELGVVATGKGWFSKEILSELLEQLKKLMEE